MHGYSKVLRGIDWIGDLEKILREVNITSEFMDLCGSFR